jgi:hypothetical protein
VPKDNELSFLAVGNPVLAAEATQQRCLRRCPSGLCGAGKQAGIPHDETAHRAQPAHGSTPPQSCTVRTSATSWRRDVICGASERDLVALVPIRTALPMLSDEAGNARK